MNNAKCVVLVQGYKPGRYVAMSIMTSKILATVANNIVGCKIEYVDGSTDDITWSIYEHPFAISNLNDKQYEDVCELIAAHFGGDIFK